MSASIWDYTDRAAFETNVLTLERLAPSQRVPSHSTVDALSSSTYQLAPEVEERLATDLAFLAAWQSTPGCVAGATLQPHHGGPGLLVTLAANEGISREVLNALQSIFALLATRTNRHHKVTEDECVSQCLTVIALLHEDRIKERLGLATSGTGKRWPARKNVDLPQRLEAIIVRIRGKLRTPGDDGTKLVDQIQAVLASRASYAKAAASDTSEHLQGLLRAVFAMTVDGCSLRPRLRSMGFSSADFKRREIRDLQALSRYCRICKYLSRVAKLYRTVFAHVELKAVEAPRVEKYQNHKHYAHAEMQLLAHHGFQLSATPPRFIGTSKLPCFLCYTFLNAYGQYPAADSHGEVFSQWTIPDRSDFQPEQRRLLGEALKRTATAVTRALELGHATRSRHAPAIQSLVHIAPDGLPTPPLSTATGSLASNGTARDTKRHVPKASMDLAAFPSEHTLRQSAKSNVASARSDTTVGIGIESTLFTIKPGRTSVLDGGGLCLFVTLERSPPPQMPSATALCSCTIAQKSVARDQPYIDLATLGVGEELTIDRGQLDDGMNIVLRGNRPDLVDLHLRWRDPTPKGFP